MSDFAKTVVDEIEFVLDNVDGHPVFYVDGIKDLNVDWTENFIGQWYENPFVVRNEHFMTDELTFQVDAYFEELHS